MKNTVFSQVILALICLVSPQAYSKPQCDCKSPSEGTLPEYQRKSYEDSELIFVGRVIEQNQYEGTFTLEVIETFKGKEYAFVEAVAAHSCSVFPAPEETYWLVYSNEPMDDEPISISTCGLSRSFTYPYLLKWSSLPPPPPPDTDYQLDHEIMRFTHHTEALKTLKSEITQLRRWRDEE